MNSQANSQTNDLFYRFQVYQASPNEEGRLVRTKSIGMAYMKECQQTITLRLWTFVTERFYLILNQKDASKYLVMTREPNKNPNAKNKYFWNIVGNGSIDSANGIVKIDLDLFEKSFYMNLYPEASAHSSVMAEPDFSKDAA
jgi:hypothetical protein